MCLDGSFPDRQLQPRSVNSIVEVAIRLPWTSVRHRLKDLVVAIRNLTHRERIACDHFQETFVH